MTSADRTPGSADGGSGARIGMVPKRRGPRPAAWTGRTDTNPYHCPEILHQMMASPDASRLLKAIKKLGPKRVQWVGRVGVDGTAGTTRYSATMWRLDGESSREGDILDAAAELKHGRDT